jgi:hypothetical protein
MANPTDQLSLQDPDAKLAGQPIPEHQSRKLMDQESRRGPRVKRDYVEKYTSNPFAMQVPNATGSALQRCSFLNSSNVLFFLFDNFALSTEQTDDSNTIEEDFRGSDGYE